MRDVSLIELKHHRVVDLDTLLESHLIEGQLGSQVTSSLSIEEAKREGCEEGMLKKEAR